MGFRLPSLQKYAKVRKGHVAVYVGDDLKKRFVIPISYLNQNSFQDLLSQSEQEFGYVHPMGGITIPCSEDIFLDVTSRLQGSYRTRTNSRWPVISSLT